ncbi:MAG: hypothetical protein E4H40_01620 [Candidatus Brocadiia bacterium]|nr:MAG: hypothetical protein E4H40_01620 [Candidatus Brocadiia bacterium]
MNWLFYKITETDFGNLHGFSLFYGPFNIAEAAAWYIIAGYVILRFLKNQRTPFEILYAASFVAFGTTDILEATSLPVWLLIAKGIILVSILLLRKKVISFYPKAQF